MGTSGANKGSKGNSPIVPPHADVDGGGPGPTDDTNRFQAFRINLGKFVASNNDRHYLEAALGSYARRSVGGHATGARRFAPMRAAGTALFGLLSDLQRGGTGTDSVGIDLSRLRGMDVAAAIQEIVEALSPQNADRELIRAAMQDALVECLSEETVFDPAELSPDFFVSLMIEYLVRCVFVHIVYESGEAFEKATDSAKATAAENALLELIKVVVDEKATPVLATAGPITPDIADTIQSLVIEEVLSVWEGYE